MRGKPLIIQHRPTERPIHLKRWAILKPDADIYEEAFNLSTESNAGTLISSNSSNEGISYEKV
jgi:hypothetical protein